MLTIEINILAAKGLTSIVVVKPNVAVGFNKLREICDAHRRATRLKCVKDTSSVNHVVSDYTIVDCSQNSTAEDGLPSNGRPALLLDSRQGFGRLVGAKHNAVRAWQQARLQLVGGAGQ